MEQQMDESRFEKGSRALAAIDGRGGREVVDSLAGIAPDLGRWVVEFVFGDVYARPGLDARQRELVTLGSLVTQGDTVPELKVHIAAALHVGLTREQVVEVILQCVPYVGFPRTINAVGVAREVFDREDREHDD
ncbi:carboxymuconolactone decarboxylase family protein [Bifidobacterium sp. ESL0784]|uniref:carboxymuconolactone decarboxylase family protein n=1 Tax=Bifidobacterium sp. ESL0784 TaxID=2983231 RepID=UPI0023F8E6F2|nr:carboxymuconolactone decarboxylase family protein [Bifidobacterium sp. ESL0784]MDF7641497.1 carboxymuconolactone decarboxylase family protein [Bifidobacterium sp. ESL0784]